MALKDEIRGALLKIRSGAPDPLKNLCAYLQRQAQNTRIHDPQDGGVFWVRGRSQELRRLATVDKENTTNEVALTRGLFNISVATVDGNKLVPLAYEAPLTRRKRGAGGENVARCDIVAALRKGRKRAIVAVEVKSKKGTNTDIAYGLLEAWAYAWLLRHHQTTSAADFASEVCSAAERYDLPLDKVTAKTQWTFTFALAGTRGYFDGQKRPDDVLNALTNLPEQCRIDLEGFWCFGPPTARTESQCLWINTVQKPPDETWYVPTLKSRDIEVL